MKYRDPETGEFKELYVKAADTLPVGTVVDFDGDEVPAGWEAVGSDDYSTEETFTGKYWIDGKKIYSKIIDFNTPTVNGTQTVVGNIENLNKLVKMAGTSFVGSEYLSLPVNDNNETYYIVTGVRANGEIYCQQKGLGNMSSHIILEYTKTTD